MSYQEFKPRQFPEITMVVRYIIIINIILFILKELSGGLLDVYLDLFSFNSGRFNPAQIITYMFMHGGISHLVFNMFGLYFFGPILETFLGSKRFINYYLLCGIGGAAMHLIVSYYTNIPFVALGASGAVLGLLLAFAMIFPNNMMQLFLFPPIKAKYFIVIYGLAELYNELAHRQGDMVGHLGHLGGILTGLIIMLIWKRY